MYCPKCGQQQVSEETRYCSRCGFLLSGVADLVANNGVAPANAAALGSTSPRTKGLKQAAFIFIVGLVLVPIWITFIIATRGPIELGVAAVFLFLSTSILRAAYALLFQSNETAAKTAERSKPAFIEGGDLRALPPETSEPARAYAAPATGGWRDTTELVDDRPSVTDTTTKLLTKEQDPQ